MSSKRWKKTKTTGWVRQKIRRPRICFFRPRDRKGMLGRLPPPHTPTLQFCVICDAFMLTIMLDMVDTSCVGPRFLPQREGFRVWDGRCFRVPVLTQVGRVWGERCLRFRFLTPVGRVYGLGRKVLLGPGSYPGWKGLGFGTEGASGSRFLPKLEGFRVWDERCLRFRFLTPVGRV